MNETTSTPSKRYDEACDGEGNGVIAAGHFRDAAVLPLGGASVTVTGFTATGGAATPGFYWVVVGPLAAARESGQ